MSRIRLVVAVLALVGICAADWGPGMSVKDAAAISDPEPGSELEKLKELAECICELIDECMPGNLEKLGKALKDKGCMSVTPKWMAWEYEYHQALEAQHRNDKPISTAAAGRSASDSVAGAGGGRNSGTLVATDTDSARIYFMPLAGQDNPWVKKAMVHNELIDIWLARHDPTVRGGGGCGPEGRPADCAGDIPDAVPRTEGLHGDAYLDGRQGAAAERA